jgi:hypothetical protein
MNSAWWKREPVDERKIALWLFNIAMENGPSWSIYRWFTGLPIKNGDFPWRC